MASGRGFAGTCEEHGLYNLLPYLARYSEIDLVKMVRALWKAALGMRFGIALLLSRSSQLSTGPRTRHL